MLNPRLHQTKDHRTILFSRLVRGTNRSVQLSGGRIFLNCADEVAIEILRRTSGIERYLDQLQCNQCEKQLIEFSLEILI